MAENSVQAVTTDTRETLSAIVNEVDSTSTIDRDEGPDSSSANTPNQDDGRSPDLSQNDMISAERREDDDYNSSSHAPLTKKRKLNSIIAPTLNKSLCDRLFSVLSCSVCLDLPKDAVYQCTNGHLMCAACFCHLLADARLKDEHARCPNCRAHIDKDSTRNLAVEKAIGELPYPCRFCENHLPRSELPFHEKESCDERFVECCYMVIGCRWQGPFREISLHQNNCTFAKKCGKEILKSIQQNDNNSKEEKLSPADEILYLLSLERMITSDQQLRPYRSDDYITCLHYDTTKFWAFNHQWIVRASVNNSRRDVAHCSNRYLTYQLMLKSKASTTMDISYFILKGPHGDFQGSVKIYRHEFSSESTESPFRPLPLKDSVECNRVLAGRSIHCRILMFLHSS